jgi:type II secretory pathway component PulF
MNHEDLARLNDEIAGMARAGLPLDQGLAALARDMSRGRLRQVTATLADDLRKGRTLPEALARQEGRLPVYYAALVAAGIRTGRIGEVLATLTIYARTQANLRAIIFEALIYPVIVLIIGAGLFTLLCTMILPQFDQIFHDFHLHLPFITEWLMSLSRHPWPLLLPVLVLAGVLVLLPMVLGMTERGRRVRARMVYAVPVLGTLIRSARLAAFTDLLGILVDHEVPLPEAFRLAGAASSEPVMAATTREINQELVHGRPLGETLRGRGLVPEWVSWMAGWGERRGHLGKTLHDVAEMYRRQVEVRAALLRSVLPPFLIILIAGLFVSLFGFAVMLPMYKLIEGLSK